MTMVRKHIFPVFVSLTFAVVVFLCGGAFAETDSGCGNYLSWALGDDGVLTISGTGDMWDFSWQEDEDGRVTTDIPWYDDRKDITCVNIGYGVRNIGGYAFCDCYNMVSVNIPESVRDINTSAFFRCSGMTGFLVDTGSSYYSSEDGVLFNKRKTSIVSYPKGKAGEYIIPENVTGVEDNAFFQCTGLTGVTIGNNLTGIREDMFHGCKNLRHVIIPDSVTSIGRSAFYTCNNLTGVNIPDGITRIEELTFYRCSSLLSMRIPDSVTSIGSQAFDYCSNLTNITIPTSVISIEHAAFSERTGLMNVYYKGTEDQWSDIEIGIDNGGLTKAEIHFESSGPAVEIAGRGTCGENLMWLLDENGVLTISGTGEMADYSLNRENGVETADSPWYGLRTQITSVEIKNGIENIGEYAFADCRNLESVTIPRSVGSIGTGAFRNCEGLTDVYYGKDETWWGKITIGSDNLCLTEAAIHYTEIILESSHPYANKTDKTWTYVHPTDAAYLKITFSEDTETEPGCDNIYLTDMDGKTEKYTGTALADQSVCFKGNRFSIRLVSDKSVTCYGFAIIGVTEISEAEYDEYMGQTITSGTCGDELAWRLDRNGLLKILGTGQMRDFYWEPDEYDGTAETDIPWYDYRKKITSVHLGKNVTSIGKYAFCECSCLTRVSISDNITSINTSAFQKCSNITGIDVSDVNTCYSSEGGVLLDKEKTYIIWVPRGITGEYVIPDSITDCDWNAFMGCTGLTKVTIGSGFTSVKEWMFAYCSNLQYVIIPDSVTSIGDYAFCLCDSLENINIPETATSIGEQAFDGCVNLTSITIPRSVTRIGLAAFTSKTGLRDVYYNGAEEQWNDIEIDDENDGLARAVIHFWTLLRLPSELTVIKSEAFSHLNCEMVIVPNACTEIEDYAFTGCSRLRYISLPVTLKDKIPPHVFEDCSEELEIEWR